MTRSEGSRAELSAWEAELLRLSFFLKMGTEVNPEEWWIKLFGREAENTEFIRTKGVRTDSGPYGGGLLVMQAKPGRVDWIFSDQPETEESNLANKFPEKLLLFLDVANRWLDSCPPVTRVAFGAVVYYQNTNRDDSYEFISNYLDFDVAGDSLDFTYQINRLFSQPSGQLWAILQLEIYIRGFSEAWLRCPMAACRIVLSKLT